MTSTLRGAFLVPEKQGARGSMRWVRDGLLTVNSAGRIESWIEQAPAGAPAETAPGSVWMPGFVDTHIHFPQTRVIARSSGALLDWLDKTVFSEESRFADPSYAREVAAEFCRTLVASGTTTASIFGSSHIGATEILFQELDRAGLRAQAGPTLMDMGAPNELCVPAREALAGCERLIAQWHGHDEGRLQFCVTPRFALSCTPELLHGAGELVRKHHLPVQTHLSENIDEIDEVARRFHEFKSYLDVYDAFGLCTERSLFGHCIHLKEREWQKLHLRGAAIAHCPDSNFFLGSGVFRLQEAKRRGIRVGLGSDVGAGRTFSLQRVAASAYDASLLAKERVSPTELLWFATAGGAEALGLQKSVGSIAVGYDADLVSLEVGTIGDFDALVDRIVFRPESARVRDTWVRGKSLRQRVNLS